MKRILIKRILNITEVPRAKRRSERRIERLFQESVAQLQEGQAAELTDICAPHKLRWHLRRLVHRGAVPSNIKIAIRRQSRNRKTAY